MPPKQLAGSVESWNGKSEDGQLLNVLLEHGFIEGMKPSEVADAHTTFMKYKNKTLASALNGLRKTRTDSLNTRGHRNSKQLALVNVLCE
jgi:hypothetical protein